MKLNENTKILIVGLGQIGGCYAQALSEKGFELGALDIDPEAITFALENEWIKTGKCNIDGDYIRGFDLIVFALYPHLFLKWIEDNQHLIRAGTLLTDVTGVKEQIVYKVQEILRPDIEYIGAHPMAGRETVGIWTANKNVFKNANYIVTPTARNTDEAIETCKELGYVLGFKKVSLLSPEVHDEMIGFLSQLTHCIAVSLMLCSDSEELADYTGDSFRDLTRIAKINDEIWSELFLLNKDNLLREMDSFTENFSRLRDAVSQNNRDELRSYMRISSERRKWFDKGREQA